ncbi:MAG: hypothetical protein EKK63_13690 [Acinetobacter sp.]|uniref:hypothetical protein n=1 Tax=Acinetobacter sp. TaxID=472 RepID=UPI000FA2CD59|nr:hypothetical protein [Acinetobacter sp.]RUP37954.1 MAG: hypothetical protein EKK63_13690 [Acinetobacter sp.]
MANRITEGIAKAKEAIEARVAQGLTTKEKVEALGKELDMDMTMYCDFQNRKSIAATDGKLTLEEAQSIYSLIGNTPCTFNSLPTHTKVVLTQVYATLLPKV